MKKQFQSKSVPRGTRTIWRYLGALFLLFTFAIGNVMAELTAHTPGVYEKTTDKGGYGCTLTTVASGTNAGTFEVYYFSAQSKYSENTTVYNGGTKQQYRLMCTDSDSEYQLINTNGTSAFTASCDWIEMAYTATGFSKSDYTFGTNKFNEFFEITPNGGNTGITKTCYIKPKEGDVMTLKVSGYVEFAILGNDNGSSKYMTITVDGGTPTSWKSSTLSRRAVSLTTGEHTIVVACVGNSANAFYGFSLKLPSCDDANASIIANTSVYVNDELDLEFSSDNTNSVVYDIKKGGSATSDASVTAGVFKATVAGTYVVTATQAKDASGHCAVEESVTITVNPKTPVASVSVAGASAGYKGIELTFTATAQYATDYEWYVDEVKQGSDSAKLLFTPSAAKTYSIVCKARNDFNETGDWIASSAHSLTVTSLYGELIRATLTGGNNATMTGIIGGTFDSNLGSGKYKLDKNVYMGVQLASGSFQEGDTVIVSMTTAGSNYPCLFADKERNTLLYLATETSSALVYKMVLPAAANNKNTVYLSRDNDVTYKWNPVVAYISVVRPMPVKSTAYDLTAVKINGTPISAANLAVLKTADAYLLDLATEYPEGPTVKFARQTTNTYEDDSQKVINDTITVTATEVSSKWQAQATIGTITYTVKMAKSAATAKVYYYDGATKLGEEIVAINANPTDAGDYDDKNLATFVDWYNNADLAEEHKIADIAALVVTKDTTVYGKWNYQYATSANIEQWVLTNGTSYDAVAQLGTLKYASNIANSLDSLNDDPSKDNRNYAYLGLKIKASGKMLDFRLANGQTVKVKLGATGNYPQVALNGGDYAAMSLTDNVWTYTAEGADAYISIKTANNNTVVIKQVMINEDLQAVTLPWRVTYNAGTGTCATAEAIWSGTALTLPDVTPAVPADSTFAGWFDGETLAGAAGASYNAEANVTLQAHFAPVEYAIAYDGNGATSGSMVAGAAGWGTLVTPATNAFEKTGHIFSGWEITKTEDGSATGITFSDGKFEMPKYDVTLVAQWEDATYAAQIGSTTYATLEDALLHAADGTIELLRNIDTESQIEILSGVTAVIDLAGHKIEYTGSATLPSGVILVHNGASLTINDSSDPDAGSIVSGANAYAAIALTKAGDDATNPAILTVNGGTLSGYYYGITGNGSRHNTVTTINGGTIIGTCTGDNLGIYHPQNGTLTINGGTITAYSAAVEMRAGELVINDGTFTATAPAFSCNPNGSGTTTVGAAIAIAQHTTKVDIAVTINGGEFNGEKAVNESNPQVNDPAPQVAMAVTGGDFTGELSTVDVDNFVSAGSFSEEVPVEYCADGYIPAPQDPVTNKYTVKEGWKVTFVDGVDEEIVPVDKDATVAEKAMSDKAGYIFDGWFNGVDLYDFAANVTSDLTLNAQWTAFAGCADLWPATGSADLNSGDVVDLQTGSFGGTIVASTDNISYGEYGLLLKSSGSTYVTVTLNNDMVENTKITVVLAAGGTSERGVNLRAAVGSTNVQQMKWTPAAIGEEKTFEYTLDAESALKDKNIFYLYRNGNVYIKSIRVESCGDAIIYHNLTSEVNIAGKGTVTLGAGTVRENHTTTATYSDIDPLYEFVSWSVSGEGASVDNATANPATITVGTEDAVVTLNLQLIPVKFTVNYYDGETLKGSELVAVNEYPTASEINTYKRHFTFEGWSKTDGGTVVDLDTITRTEATTINLYAVYAPVACPTEGTVFSMEFDPAKTPTETVVAPKNGGVVELADYATISGGDARIINNNSSNKDAISTDGKFLLKASDEVMKIELDCAIAAGDVIRIPDNSAKAVLSTSDAKTGTYATLADKNAHEFEATSDWNNVDDLYILYDGSSLSFTKVYVLRPYTVSFDLQGHGDAIDAQKLVEGKKVEEPTAPTADGWDFKGWYKEAACTNAWDFDNDVVDGAMSLFAKWTEHVTNDATLKSLKYGSTAITLVDGTYEYNVELAAAVATVPALSAETNAALATKEITNATEFVAGQASSTVLVTAEDGATQLLYTVNFTKEAAIELQDVTGNMKWDFSKTGIADQTAIPANTVLANVEGAVNNPAIFESDNIMATGGKQAGTKLQASMIKFHTTVPGAVIVKFANTGSKTNYRYLVINDVQTEAGSKNSTVVTYAQYVQAGDVVLTVTTADGGNMFNFTSVEFKVDNDLEPYRDDEWLAPGELGTICIPQGAVAVGADIYELVGKEPQYGKIVFETVEHMKPGKPYLFQSKGTRIDFILTDETLATEPDNSGAMKGTFSAITLTDLTNVYYFADHALWSCVDLTSLSVPANRAYVQMDEVDPISSPSAAPGRRRITMNVNGEKVVTGVENLNASEQPVKLLINGQIFILRGEKLFDATGRLVK